jgi:hypothetical protein
MSINRCINNNLENSAVTFVLLTMHLTTFIVQASLMVVIIWLQYSGLYFIHVTIVNDDCSIVSKFSFKLNDDPIVIIYDHHRFIIQATIIQTQ